MKILFLLIALAMAGQLEAKWYVDNEFRFKIDVPSNWSSNMYMEGTDKVYDFTSPDENVAIQLRAFVAEKGLTADLITDVFDEAIVAQGASRLKLLDEQLNGIQGKMGVYRNTYDNKEVALVTFAAVENGIGYLFLVVIPTEVFDRKLNETDAILNTFTLLNEPDVVTREKQPREPDQPAAHEPENESKRIGLTLPPGKQWPEGVWPKGQYDCGNKMFLGVIGLNDTHISWTGDNYIFRPNFYLPKGEATWETRLHCPYYENWCRIDAQHKWSDSQGSYIIEITFPQGVGMKDAVSMKVHTSSTGWINVSCNKIE
ncbi:MAG: hypothetical protein K9G67_03835 [Bacteroidales bacterium]|nr:hypothetical protein [Bacteroidales bacterium]MCF8344907.1 hypothetical protein [Bacteroidales bacterium]MCF8349944.1 hypothetical protein [Bacteroidales bacterium]MCF8375461.1 hypothetical protein [Bacteroidales bacterium]MCF8402111.1 hypothetical protein [Bacteroidales bacterium]